MGVALLLVILKLDLIKTENTDNTENTGARMLRRIKKKKFPKWPRQNSHGKFPLKILKCTRNFALPTATLDILFKMNVFVRF